MIHVTQGIVLSRRPIREWDRLADVYTRDFGRLKVRFIGVDRPTAKLRTFAEPLVRADFRLYLRPAAQVARGIGGALLCVYPRIRQDLGRMTEALYCCELMAQLTPEQQPSREKFDLLAGTLDAVEGSQGNGWVTTAFALRLLELAGFGIKGLPPGDLPAGLWQSLHEDPWPILTGLSADPVWKRRCRSWVDDHLAERVGRHIKSGRFLEEAVPTEEVV